MEIGTIEPVDIDHEMRTAYIDYAMSVIVSRALPDARDGLKPVHRRILYAMHDMGIHSNTAFKKSARIVGEVMGKYHPHGDLSVYDAMARMAQDFSMRYLLIDGQGNFGSVDGDAPAAMRYTEARLGVMADEMLVDIDKNTVDYVDNFDATLQEPSVLPSRLPNLLLNGASGIAVGMATNIPPHNLNELVSALCFLIDHFDTMEDITVDDLLAFVKGPDFPTGGILVGADNIRQAYSTGRGSLIVRGKASFEEIKGGRYAIHITEIPFQINKSTLIERIADLVREDRITGISDLRDESDRNGMCIVIELKRGVQPKMVLNQLFKYTALQSTFGLHLLALVEGEPRLLSLKRALQIYIEHRQSVITRRTQFELDKARRREHILQGLMIALANLDAVIKTIRESPDAEQAKMRLMERFKLSDLQSQAILDMQLRRLAALERQKIEDEHREVMSRIAYFEDLLGHSEKILGLIRDDLVDLAKKYGDDRRTLIAGEISSNFNEQDLVADEAVLVSITQRGYIKRVSIKAYRLQGRGRRGVTGQAMREEDQVMILIPARTLDTILFFSDRGKVYSLKTHQIPAAQRTERGVPAVNLLALETNERITSALAAPDFTAANYCAISTVNGMTKRVQISEFANVRPSGLIAMSLASGDELGWVCLTSGKDDLIFVTTKGLALRISETDIRISGRQASGVKAIKLRPGDKLASMEVVEPEGHLLIVTEKGFGKRTSLGEYSQKSRAGKGMKTINQNQFDRIGKIAAALVVQEDDEVTVITSGGLVLRLKVSGVRASGRGTRGIRLMDIHEGESVASLARISARTLARETEGEPAENGAEEIAPGENGTEEIVPGENGAEETMPDENGSEEIVTDI
jgi:DNA gyrase subunit A